MKFSDTDQSEMLLELGAVQVIVKSDVVIMGIFTKESEPVIFNDGSVEQGKPYCTVTEKDVTDNEIAHGTLLTIEANDWFVIGVQHKQSGFYHLTLSESL